VLGFPIIYLDMDKIIAVLFEEKKEESYIAIELYGNEHEILLTKGPSFEKQMGPYPVPYAEATFKRWNYSKVKNPPEADLKDKKTLMKTMLSLYKTENNSAEFCRQNQDE
jgi:hypothetical protein